MPIKLLLSTSFITELCLYVYQRKCHAIIIKNFKYVLDKLVYVEIKL